MENADLTFVNISVACLLFFVKNMEKTMKLL